LREPDNSVRRAIALSLLPQHDAILFLRAGFDANGLVQMAPIEDIEKAAEGEKIEDDSDAMKALETYIYWSNRGSKLDPGRH